MIAPPLSILDLSDAEPETPAAAIDARAEGHLSAIARYFPGVAARREGDSVVYETPLRIDLGDRAAVLKMAAIYPGGRLRGGGVPARQGLADGVGDGGVDRPRASSHDVREGRL